VVRERNWLTATHQLHCREAHGHIVLPMLHLARA
jgi:hypothetical protein